jgi:hypothetical protein
LHFLVGKFLRLFGGESAFLAAFLAGIHAALYILGTDTVVIPSGGIRNGVSHLSGAMRTGTGEFQRVGIPRARHFDTSS